VSGPSPAGKHDLKLTLIIVGIICAVVLVLGGMSTVLDMVYRAGVEHGVVATAAHCSGGI